MLIYQSPWRDHSFKLLGCKYDSFDHHQEDHCVRREEEGMFPEDGDDPFTKQSSDVYLKNSIFVANLSQQLCNADLACALFSLFRPFGPIRSIKASRDNQLRPFGFIEFYCEEACNQALSQNLVLELAGRPLRMERARRQLKLLVKYNGGVDIAEQKKRLELILQGQRMSILQEGGVLSAIVRLDKPSLAKELFQKCNKLFTEEQGWKVSWMNGDENGVSSIRSSGLVHLVFNPEDTVPLPAEPSLLHQYLYSPPSLLSLSITPPNTTPSPEPTQLFNHKIFNFEQDINGEVEAKSEIYVGRLASLAVTLHNLKAHFSDYGEISYIRLFNRGIVGLDAPVDAFAYIGYVVEASGEKAIEGEDGNAWLGQVITVQPLDPSRIISIQ